MPGESIATRIHATRPSVYRWRSFLALSALPSLNSGRMQQGGCIVSSAVTAATAATAGSDKTHFRAFMDLLRPYKIPLLAGFLAACGESLVGLLEPWPLKIVLDNVVQSRPLPAWLRQLFSIEGADKLTTLKLAA